MAAVAAAAASFSSWEVVVPLQEVVQKGTVLAGRRLEGSLALDDGIQVLRDLQGHQQRHSDSCKQVLRGKHPEQAGHAAQLSLQSAC